MMKKNYKRILCAVLIVMTMFSMIYVANFSVSAEGESTTETSTTTVSETTESQTTESSTEVSETETSESETETTTESVTETSTTKPAPTTKPVPTTTKPAPKPTVGNVKGLKKVSKNTDSIKITWKKVKGATGYVVYCRNVDNSNSFRKVSVQLATNLTIKNIPAATPYYVKVAAYVNKNGKSYIGNYSLLRTSTQPAAVKNLKVVSASKNIKLTWNKSNKGTGYKVFRKNLSANGKYVQLKTIKGKSKNTFTDTKTKSGRIYIYQVQTYRKYSATGSTYHSDKTSVRAACGLGPVKIKTSSELNKIKVSWNSTKGASGYLLYSSTSKNGNYKKIKATRSTSYQTGVLKKGTTYYYKVVPYAKSGGQVLTGNDAVKSQKVSDKIFGKSVGSTYIEVSISQQHMWFYINGKLYVDTPVVTGNDDGAHNTPKGVWPIFQRMSPTVLVGADYRCPVDYWLAFTQSGCGIHDSTWRPNYEYGGTTYKGNGSHGCVNTPHSKVAKIYKKAKIGTKVIVH